MSSHAHAHCSCSNMRLCAFIIQSNSEHCLLTSGQPGQGVQHRAHQHLCSSSVCAPSRRTLHVHCGKKEDHRRNTKTKKRMCHKGTFQKRFSGFCPLRGYPPPHTPLTENQCEKRRIFSLADRGGPPPP